MGLLGQSGLVALASKNANNRGTMFAHGYQYDMSHL